MNPVDLLQSQSFLSLAGGFLLAGFIGSWHCALMCGPMACYLAEQKKLSHYHLGRLIGYLTLGAFAGQISQIVFNHSSWLPRAVLLFFGLVIIGSFLLKAKTSFIIFKKLSFIRKMNSGLVLGLGTILLPCGWLYSFVMAAFAARSAPAGMMVMGLFWLSSIPSLSIAPMGLKKIIASSNLKQQKIARYVLFFSSLYSIGSFLLMH